LEYNNTKTNKMKNEAITLEQAEQMTEYRVKPFKMGYPVEFDYVTITVKDIDDWGKVTYYEDTYKLKN